MENDSTVELIKQTLDKVRPFMQREGGDVTFDSFEDGIVYVNIQGACQGCSYLDADLEQGVEIILMEEVPGVIAVRLASDKEAIKKALEKAKNEKVAK
jgi:Fe-S cluster biogenesis protein NfuA